MKNEFIPADHGDWLQLREHLSLKDSNAANDARSLPTGSAVYLWTVLMEGRETALYVGQASSLARRIYNCTQPFQPHSPNDRKLYFAQKALEDRYPAARFPLYWKPASSINLNGEELSAVKLFSPLLNRRSSYSKDHTAKLEAAYENLYFEVLSNHLGEA